MSAGSFLTIYNSGNAGCCDNGLCRHSDDTRPGFANIHVPAPGPTTISLCRASIIVYLFIAMSYFWSYDS